MTKDATARIRINKLLEAAGWRFFADSNGAANIRLEPGVTIKSTELDALGENFEKAAKGFVDFLLLDARSFPLLVLEAKAGDKNPLVGKEQARKYARSQNCRFVILSNGNLHYFWDLECGNPYVITSFPTPESVSGYLINPTVVDARTEITTALLSEEGFVVSFTDDAGEDQQQAFKQREFEKRFFADARITEILRVVDEIQHYSRPVIEHCYRDFLLQNNDPEEREYPDSADQIREVLIHGNYLSQKDIETCLVFDFASLADAPGRDNMCELHEVLRVTFGSGDASGEAPIASFPPTMTSANEESHVSHESVAVPAVGSQLR